MKESLKLYAKATVKLTDSTLLKDFILVEFARANLFSIAEVMENELNAAKSAEDNVFKRPKSLLRIHRTSSKASTTTAVNTSNTVSIQ